MSRSEHPHGLHGAAPDPAASDSDGRRVILPPVDSAAHAERCRRDLALSRERAAQLGRSAWRRSRAGSMRPRGSSGRLARCRRRGRRRQAQSAARGALAARARAEPATTRVQVVNATTLVAAKRLTETGERVLALNFANGVEPGGGFLHGARAQEEVLCRSSALYATLGNDPMYEAHRQRPLPDSTDRAILSPDVPVFRSDDGTPLDAPWPLSVITCAAPYAPRVGQPRAGDLLQQRIARVLAIARAYGYTGLVLGAWGCGAFGNDPHRTARDFHAALMPHAGAFAQVVFAVADWSPERRFLAPFALRFAPTS
jgi:uncharacterized protein (TIGR02452 family)